MAINGTNGSDTFDGTRFDDEINGLGGNDFFGGSRGQDRLDGDGGTDTVNYSRFRHVVPGPWTANTFTFGEAVDVDLQRATQSGGYADGDVLIDIENVTGSGESDVIRGDGGANC